MARAARHAGAEATLRRRAGRVALPGREIVGEIARTIVGCDAPRIRVRRHRGARGWRARLLGPFARRESAGDPHAPRGVVVYGVARHVEMGGRLVALVAVYLRRSGAADGVDL